MRAAEKFPDSSLVTRSWRANLKGPMLRTVSLKRRQRKVLPRMGVG
jgi:hypothetical protein